MLGRLVTGIVVKTGFVGRFMEHHSWQLGPNGGPTGWRRWRAGQLRWWLLSWGCVRYLWRLSRAHGESSDGNTTVAFVAFSASSLNLISLKQSEWETANNPVMKTSSIGGKKYLDYLWDPYDGFHARTTLMWCWWVSDPAELELGMFCPSPGIQVLQVAIG